MFDRLRFQFFSETELQRASPKSDTSLDPNKGMFLVVDNASEKERLTALLARKGIRFNPTTDTAFRLSDEPDVFVKIEITVDTVVARGIAKIALNYLAHREGPDFALRPHFDAAREFIRCGNGEWREFIEISNRPILFDDSARWRQTNGHIVVVESTSQQVIRGRISPFNDRTYVVRLGRLPLWVKIAHGHFFDVVSRRVLPLGHAPQRLLPPY